MADDQWLKEDGYLNVDADSTNIIYHPHLNVILVFTKAGDVKVLDVNSGVILQSCSLSVDGRKVKGKYLPKHDKVLFWDGRNIGLRGDYNGVLLLDTILQTPTIQTDDMVKIELLLSEALLFLQCIKNLEEIGLENTADVSNELTAKIVEAQANAKKGIKAQKWNIICLELPHSSLKMVANRVLYQLKRLDRHIPALAIASAINERLTDLLMGGRLLDSVSGGNAQRCLMFSEAARRQTFEQWPHMDYKWALPDQMAQAGFYHQPSESGDDRAMCFTCNVCLVCWEKTDEPWSEHERHSPTCPFVKGEYTQNVPLSVTYATSPAIMSTEFSLMSNGDDGNIICTGNRNGDITIWNVERQLKKNISFNIRKDENILKSSCTVACETDKLEINLTALSTHCIPDKYILVSNSSISRIDNASFSASTNTKAFPTIRSKILGTKICCGLSIKCKNSQDDIKSIEEEHRNNDAVIAMNIENQAKSIQYGIKIPSNLNNCSDVVENNDCFGNGNQLFLIIYEIVDKNDIDTLPTIDIDTISPASTGIKSSPHQNQNNIDDSKKSSLKNIELAERFDDVFMKVLPDYDALDNNTHTQSKINELQDFLNPKISKLQNKHLKEHNQNGISDFIAEVQPNNSKKYKVTDDNINCVIRQCISLKSIASESYEITEIIPSHDKKYLLVVLRQQLLVKSSKSLVINNEKKGHFSSVDENHEQVHEDQSKLNNTKLQQEETSIEKMTQLILFKIQENGLLNETPHCVRILFEDMSPVEICMLPGYESDKKFGISETQNGVFVMTCYDGTLKLIALTSLRTISEASIDGVKFVSATYCKSLERMCGCTENGSLHFYSFYDLDNESGDEQDEQNAIFMISDSSLSDDSAASEVSVTVPKKSVISNETIPSTSTASSSHADQAACILAHKSQLTLTDLKCAYSLTQFDEMLTPYTAEVPGCWSELVQAQKVRRHPQHLKPGDDTHLTKTWRLHNDATTWDEHLIELSLPKSASLGHIDFKFSLYQQCPHPPAIQITLLKQFSSGFGYRMKAPSNANGNISVDENVEFNLNSQDGKSSIENPVLTVEYLQTHNAEILAGPMELSSCMDLNEQSGTVILTSPKLFKTKGRNYLIHIKTMADPSKDGQGKTRGCDWLHEISITVRSTKPFYKIINERVQRCAMLESNSFLTNLLKLASQNKSTVTQNIALDIIYWIVSIRMTRYRSPKNTENTFPDVHTLQKDCIKLIENSLCDLIRSCILLGNRSIAHKCVKIIMSAIDGAQNMKHNRKSQNISFEDSLKNAILASIPFISSAKYAGALRWFTLLICGSSNVNSQGAIAEKCIQLLLEVAIELGNRYNSCTALLRTRFGLYGMPFELELFDADLPISNKYSLLPLTFATIIKSASTQQQQQQNQTIDLKNFCVADGNELKILPYHLRRRCIGNQMKGLLEVEPLHFICCAASEATRLENMDSISAAQAANIIDDIIFETPTANNIEHAPNDVKKDSTNKDNVEDDLTNILVDKIFYSALKKYKKQEETYSKLNNEDADDFKSLSEFSINIVESDSPEAETSSNVKLTTNEKQKFISESSSEDSSNALPWHKLLNVPPKQMIVIDRMHSGARRFVILDFGTPIMLTDLVIPACEDLVSIFVDIWCFEEETDSLRLVVASDIGSKTLVLSDLQPPPICRFVKITITGRYGMSATRCKIPIGSFYGHTIVLDKDSNTEPALKYIKTKSTNLPAQLKVLHSLFEDVHCRYSLASNKLIELLDPLLNSDVSNMAHMQAYLYRTKENDDSAADHGKIINLYEECIAFQHQLNVIKNVIQRLETAMESKNSDDFNPTEITMTPLANVCTDKLRVLSECLVEVLLHLIIEYGMKNVAALHIFFNQNTCNILFNTLVVEGDTQMQLATCSFLVKMCCFQAWWGDFIASIFTKLYSSQNSKIFPQDRVFFLLTYLGRKSIAMGTCRSIVIDAILKTLAKFLTPLSNQFRMDDTVIDDHDSTSNYCKWASTDLQLIGWLLLFLSVCLDDTADKKDQSSVRWDFMSGEADMSKTRSQGTGNSRTFSRSFKKRLFQNKLYNTGNLAEKLYMMKAETQVAQITSQFELAIKQELASKENHLKKAVQNTIKQFPDYFNEMNTRQKSKATRGTSQTLFGNTSTSKVGKDISIDIDPPFDIGLRALKSNNTIIVIRGLIGLILGMDFTCNMDLFLLTCKVIARLVSACKSTIQLSRIITTSQLQQLIRIAVWKDQQQPWAIHAITCLLQDILETDKNFKGTEDNLINDSSTLEVINSENLSEEAAGPSSERTIAEQLISDITSMVNKDIQYADALKINYLPSLMECDDTEMEDLLDDIDMTIERTKNPIKKDGSQNRNGLSLSYRSVSSALDARLEYGLETNIEISLRRLSVMASLNLFANLPQITLSENSNTLVDLPPWPEYIIQAWSGPEYNHGISTNHLLMLVFDNIFADLHLQESWLNLEQILQIWLTLNGELSDKTSSAVFLPTEILKIPFGRNAVQGLLSALSWHPGIKLRIWCLGFQCLTLACSPYVNVDVLSTDYQDDFNENQCNKMGIFIVNNPNFEKMLLRFFTGTDISSSTCCTGPTVCKLLRELFNRLEIKSDAPDIFCVKKKLKETLLRVLLNLIQSGGAISIQQGPIDAQNQLIKELISFQYEKTDLGVALSIIESVSFLVYNNMSNVDKLYCHKTTDTNKSYNIFGSLFATVLGSESSAKTKSVSDNSLLINLLKLSTVLIQTAVPRPGEEIALNESLNESSESQTDETKAEQQHNEQQKTKIPYVADTVLQHYPTMARLLGTLSHCSSSSFALLACSATYSTVNPLDTKNTFGEPQTVADAVFQLLMLLSKKATQPVLVVKPLYDFLNSTSGLRHALPRLQLSEPFLWFMLKVLDSPATVAIFTEMGGIKVLCQNLVRSNRTLINIQPGLVSMIMQHLTKSPKVQTQPSTSNTNGNGIKKASSASLKTNDGLINFAPFCSISSDNSTAQQADVLIQLPIASHRRGRTPAWSYLFYPNESYVDLTITFPTAVLMREIQLQPHLPSLASCPYAVAVEITRDNAIAPIPISQPMSTVGMTCIKLRFNQPEIATSVVLRLYRPRDSSSIGLTQISIFGTTTFSDVITKTTVFSDLQTEDDNLAKSSLGWLRLLARCFSVATFKKDANISNAVISSAAEYPGFLEACCSLLNVTPMTSTVALQNMETVLLKLGLHNRDLGLKMIDILLKNTIPQTFKLCNDTVSDLLYDLCTNDDNYTRDRIETIINWIQNLYHNYEYNENLLHTTNPYSGFIKCIAAILWTAHSSQLVRDLDTLITKELFESVYQWTLVLDNNEPLKKSIDAILCSICCIRPEMFPMLLRKMGVLVPNLSTDLGASISDDRKDTEGMTDDIKQEESDTAEWYSHLVIQDISKLFLTKNQLHTIALSCQSPLAVHQLLDSGLPRLLTSCILEFCHCVSSDGNKDKEELERNFENGESSNLSCLTDSDKAESTKRIQNENKNVFPMVSVNTCAEILNFFSETCSEGNMRDWLGSYSGSVFWTPLLDILCNLRPLNQGQIETSYSYLEDAMIKFLSKVTSCHPKNQEALTVILIAVIRKSGVHSYTKQSISGFTRRLVLQLLLESERVLVSVHSDIALHRREQGNLFINNHPSKRSNAHHLLFYMSTHTRCQEILESCITVYSHIIPTVSNESKPSTEIAAGSSNGSSSSLSKLTKNELLEFGIGHSMELLSVAAGVTAKDKRLKDVKNQAAVLKAKELLPLMKLNTNDSLSSNNIISCAQLTHSSCPGILLTSDTTISQILAMLQSSGDTLSSPCINLNLIQGRKQPDDISDESLIKASDFEPLPSPLQIFSSRGGLSLLAYYLPIIYPDTPKSTNPSAEKDKSPPLNEWVKVEPNDDIYEDLDDTLTESGSKLPTISSVPPHSLSAFGLFLRLPPYSDVLLRDKTRAQCLLRLVLGVTGDGEGNEIYSLSLASTLPTLPFDVFRQLLDSSPLTTDDGVLLRRMVIEVGAIHLVLNCLGIFTHHSQTHHVKSTTGINQPDVSLLSHKNVATSTDDSFISDDKSHVYWAKGTGFGTGSTQQSWDVEQALLRQKSEEEHVTVLLQVLSSYINPGDKVPSGVNYEDMSYHDINDDTSELPPIFFDLLQHSCLIPALCSYLRNDSVLDITRHIPLYRAILQLLRAIALSNQLVSLLLPQRKEESTMSIASLLTNMKTCVDTYASRLKLNKKSNIKGQTQRVTVSLDDGDDEGLALLIPDIQETTYLVLRSTNADQINTVEKENPCVERPISRSIEQRYLEVMKKLQFDTYEMISETENGYRFVVSYHFESNMRMTGERGHPARVKRLAQETVTLSTSLPLSYSSSVFVRCDTDRLDIMKVLITGPAETPYANGCFEFDVFFPPDYPNSPMMINLETTGRHTVRFNPNLYNDGKVCLSVLNTWHGRPEEKWNAQTSSFLQVLVSIQSLILVPEPYFNEPGFERSRGTPSGTHSSREYNSNIYQSCVRWAMLEQIKTPNPCFKEVIYTHFWLKRHEICAQIEEWIAELSKPQYSERNGRTISFNSMVLRRQYRQLREELAKLPTPDGLEDLDRPFVVSIPSPKAESSGTSMVQESSSTPSNVSQIQPLPDIFTSFLMDDDEDVGLG